MSPRLRPVGVWCLLACVLIAAASGDDFNLLRLVLTPSLIGSASLPLDDPNTDFIRSTDSRHRAQSREYADEGTAPAGSWPGAVHAPLRPSPLAAAAAGNSYFPRAEMNLPLLC
jgi:hypothetical protein